MSSGEPLLPPYNVVFVLGGPGSGKGTQCVKVASMKEYEYVHLSAGELLRQESNTPGSAYKEIIDTYIVQGNIVPVQVTCALLRRAMVESNKTNFLIDGFPRNEDNLSGWQKDMSNVATVKGVLFFSCPKEVCVQRILERGKTSGRTDDNVESLEKRFETYLHHTMPIIEYYKKRGLVYEIDSNRSENEIFEDVRRCLSKLS